MTVLTTDDRAFFDENGYVIVHEAVPQKNLDAVIAAIWEFLGMNPADPEDWYRPPHLPGGTVELYQHPALWDNRQYPRVHQAFSELFGTPELWVSMDRASMKPPQHPAHPDYDNKGFIHWDTDTSQLPQPFGVQGVLYLTDTSENQGGFQCVPEIFRNFDAWLQTQPADRNPRHPDLNGHAVTPIPGKAGDLVIWHKLLAHGNGHNVSDKPRLAQYITMFPNRQQDEAARESRIEAWRERHRPKGGHWGTPDEPRQWEQKHGKTAELTPLGRKLLGLDLW